MAEVKKKNIEVITQNGECKLNISLEITINLNSDDLQLKSKGKEEIQEEKDIWAIPEFNKSEKIKFGKKG